MLGVLKRRWKPSKRSSNGRGNESSISSDFVMDKPRSVPSPRQIHPLYGEKAGLLGYYDAVGNTENFPPAPNIVVEGGRIEFVRPSQESTINRKNSVSRGSQTCVEQLEKSDSAKENLEERIRELEKILQNERAGALRDRTTITKLQLKREATLRDVERERRLRLEAESRVRDATAEAEHARARVHHLQRELSRMEESSRGLLQHKQKADQLKQERTALTISYETRIHQCQAQISKLQLENESIRGQLRGLEAACVGEVHAALVARLATLETEHVALARDADAQRRQYERCLDDVANQVVRALLSQKGLREEIGTLQRRIHELETQNRALSELLAQTTTKATTTTTTTTTENKSSELIRGIIEAGPNALVAALGFNTSAASWVPLPRPRSLNLKIPTVITATKYKRHRSIGQKISEEEGSESPESINRDEGYSTMSSDVQGEGPRGQEPSRGLEDLKEATDETEADLSPDARLIALDTEDPDIIFFPLNLTVGINSRHSYPPSKQLLSYQHVMPSFSDSHLYLKLTTSNIKSSPCCNIQSPTGSSSLFFVEEDGWDTDYVQQWLRLDDSRSAQQHRDLLELEYDRAELEDWSFSLSTDDLRSESSSSLIWKEENRNPFISSSTLAAIKEQNPIELEEDANECLWNGASYLADRTGGELVALLMDAGTTGPWPYASSPGASWSSGEEGILESSSKRSSAALSGCGSDDPDSPSIGTDFTRDFYRLVKFESTKSLASTSSKSGKQLPPDREQALQSVLSFIAEQQMYLTEMPNNSDSKKFDQTHSIQVLDYDYSTKNDSTIISSPSLNEQQQVSFERCERNSAYCCCIESSDKLSANISNYSSNSINSCNFLEPYDEIKTVENLHQDKIIIEPCDVGSSINSNINANQLNFSTLTTSSSTITTIAAAAATTTTSSSSSSSSTTTTELGAVPEEDEEAVTSSTPSTVVSPVRTSLFIEGLNQSLSFHERATSKDVINELNRMIRKGEDNQINNQDPSIKQVKTLEKLDLACCCPTGWVHVERDIDFTDPKARANLLDVMLASSESSSAASSSAGSAAGSDSGDEPLPDYRYLHRLHRYRRQKKGTKPIYSVPIRAAVI
ncbi:serine-rich adhesin for platelets-like isoform X4 [Microplitis mediator]|uniref:serine-rich adhesin for platelets-like isoform X4 n=1 Tax=Microplitis mediator TaxID=375433 RepID=UPI0025556EA6|nr:serine-rich adhesin for platelets-like isoform X4 [Microplitis mediator]